MTSDSPIDAKSLGPPTIDQCTTVYGSMLTPTVRTFHAKMVAAGYDISLSGAQRFIARHIKKPQPKPDQAPAVVGCPLTSEELNLIQKDLAELRPLDTAALKARFEREVLIYYIMLLRFSQLNADRLAMSPKESAALVKSMSEASAKVSASPIPVITPDGRMVDISPNEPNPVSEAIRLFQLGRGIAN